MSIIIGVTGISTYYAEKIIEELENNTNNTVTPEYEIGDEPTINLIEVSGMFTEDEMNIIYAIAEDWGAEILSVA